MTAAPFEDISFALVRRFPQMAPLDLMVFAKCVVVGKAHGIFPSLATIQKWTGRSQTWASGFRKRIAAAGLWRVIGRCRRNGSTRSSLCELTRLALDVLGPIAEAYRARRQRRRKGPHPDQFDLDMRGGGSDGVNPSSPGAEPVSRQSCATGVPTVGTLESSAIRNHEANASRRARARDDAAAPPSLHDEREEPNHDSGRRKERERKGTRIDEWRPTVADADFAAGLGLDGQAVFAEFIDYWQSIPGWRGLKLDWSATWRNRCRVLAERARRPGRSGEDRSISAAIIRGVMSVYHPEGQRPI